MTNADDRARRTVAVVVPPVLLVAVAVAQIILSRTVELTPWKGGGFGMFSTLDHGAYRGVDALVEAPDRSEWLDVPESLELELGRAAACPIDVLLARLGEGIVSRERRHERAVARVTLRVWRTEFDPATLQPVEQTIRSYVHEAR